MFKFLWNLKPSAGLNVACAIVGLLILCGVVSLFVSGHWFIGLVSVLAVFAFVNAGEAWQSDERKRKKAERYTAAL